MLMDSLSALGCDTTPLRNGFDDQSVRAVERPDRMAGDELGVDVDRRIDGLTGTALLENGRLNGGLTVGVGDPAAVDTAE